MGHLRVTIGHLRVTIGHHRVTIGHLSLTIGYLKATVIHIRATLGHLRVTIGYFFSIRKHKANKTELHPKVRQTCLYCIHNCLKEVRTQFQFTLYNPGTSLYLIIFSPNAVLSVPRVYLFSLGTEKTYLSRK